MYVTLGSRSSQAAETFTSTKRRGKEMHCTPHPKHIQRYGLQVFASESGGRDLPVDSFECTISRVEFATTKLPFMDQWISWQRQNHTVRILNGILGCWRKIS